MEYFGHGGSAYISTALYTFRHFVIAISRIDLVHLTGGHLVLGKATAKMVLMIGKKLFHLCNKVVRSTGNRPQDESVEDMPVS